MGGFVRNELDNIPVLGQHCAHAFGPVYGRLLETHIQKKVVKGNWNEQCFEKPFFELFCK